MHAHLKILFIKTIRQEYGHGLKDAKELTEMWAMEETLRRLQVSPKYEEALKKVKHIQRLKELDEKLLAEEQYMRGEKQ